MRESDSSRRLAIASLFAALLVGAATVGTIWRYQHASDQSASALKARTNTLRAEQASKFFWRERETMNEYVLRPAPALLVELANEKKGFDRVAGDLAVGDGAERTLVTMSSDGNDAFFEIFRQTRHVAGRGPTLEESAVEQLNGAERRVLGPLQALQAVYANQVRNRQSETRNADHQARITAVLGALLAFAATAGLALYSRRLLRHLACQREADRRQREADRRLAAARGEFVDMLQVTAAEEEADELLKRQLERMITHSSVVIPRRNNSADRLEPTTPPGPELAERLQGAEPRSCLAVRFGRLHEEGESDDPIVRCTLCARKTGYSTCQPLLVSGEVIGSALVTHKQPLTEVERATIALSVGHAGPVLANLRNLALAEFRAATDALTGLPNSRAVYDTTKRMLAQASRTVSPLAAILLDLDHFKQINDTYGHGRGDDVLAALGQKVRDSLRESDFVGRYGGEEFLILLPATRRAEALGVAEKVRAAVETITIPGITRLITASLGVAVFPDDAGDSTTLLRQADRGLYAAKAKGRNCVEVAHAPSASSYTPLETNRLK